MSLFLNLYRITRHNSSGLFFLSFFFPITNSRFKFYRPQMKILDKRSWNEAVFLVRQRNEKIAQTGHLWRVCVRSRNFRQAEKKVGRKEGARARLLVTVVYTWVNNRRQLFTCFAWNRVLRNRSQFCNLGYLGSSTLLLHLWYWSLHRRLTLRQQYSFERRIDMRW